MYLPYYLLVHNVKIRLPINLCAYQIASKTYIYKSCRKSTRLWVEHKLLMYPTSFLSPVIM